MTSLMASPPPRRVQCAGIRRKHNAEQDEEEEQDSVGDSEYEDGEENDSMRPVCAEPRRSRSSRRHRRKRQRRTILDAFGAISLARQQQHQHQPHPSRASADSGNYISSNNFQQDQLKQADCVGEDDADSSQAVADEGGFDSYSTTSSLEDYDYEDEFDEDDSSTNATPDELPSDKDARRKGMERKVMLELVFGPESNFVPTKDPVDRQLDKLIQKSIQQVSNGGNAISTQDDMSIGLSSDNDSLMSGGACTNNNGTSTSMRRSNSLPDFNRMETVDGGMDLD